MKDFSNNFVEFDYDIWKKFKLKLYYPENKLNSSIPISHEVEFVWWPVTFLCTNRKHEHFRGVALIKEPYQEKLVEVNLDNGSTTAGGRIYMDLDSALSDTVLRRNKGFLENLRVSLRTTWTTIKILFSCKKLKPLKLLKV